MAQIVLDQLCKSFDNIRAVCDVNLKISDGEFVVLVGPSGCGKSTTLRMIAGLEDATSGSIFFGDAVVNNLSPRERNIAMVFQSYALYPHMTVERNMGFALEQEDIPKSEISLVVRRVAEMLGISDLLARKPKALSGGQRQRVAMGRAIVRRPHVFLFDEPLSNLDAALRTQMRLEIKKLHRLLKTTVIYVTHDQVEAMTLADRIVVMDQGKVVQVGSPMEVYEHPRTRFVAGFIGAPRMNFISCRVAPLSGSGIQLEFKNASAWSVPESHLSRFAAFVNRTIEIGIRPEQLEHGLSDRTGAVAFEVIPEVVEPMGADTMVFVTFGDAQITARFSPETEAVVGKTLWLSVNFERIYVVDTDTGLVTQS